MVEAILSGTLETLRDLLVEEAKFLYGVSSEVTNIKTQLEIMKSFLKDADQRQHTEETIRTWIKQVRRLAYKTEDVLETYVAQVVSEREQAKNCVFKRFVNIFSECFALHNIFSECFALHKVGKEIEDIKSEIADMKKNRETFNIRELNVGESSKKAREKQRLLRQTIADEVEEHFVGMESDIRELLSLITDNEREHRVISIWGFGGLGKTTLARKIFNHKVVQVTFESCAWVCITQQCEINNVLKDILKQLGNPIIEDQPVVMVRELHKVLEKKKCLVVLDDIWKTEDWEILKHAFPISNASSKILLTTRIQQVAEKGYSYQLSLLTPEDGWELLMRKALIKQKGRDVKTFEGIGKEIVGKCGYLPLAITVLGGILENKSSHREWEAVNKEIDLYLQGRRGNQGASQSVHKILGLSYDELPYYLKPCFLYMGRYGEDQSIDVVDIYHQWIAEGLVLSEHRGKEESMMDVAESYLDELATRCMVEIKMDEVSINPMSKQCRLHDLMRDLCLSKGKEEEFSKVISIRNQDFTAMDLSSLSHDYGRRLYIDTHEEEFRPAKEILEKIFEKVNGQSVRTLFVEYMSHRYILSVDLRVMKFKLLRVLCLENFEFELPAEINQLIYLRYLSLKKSSLKELPSSISNLPYLQTLDLRLYQYICIHLPNIFWKMKRLKHIYLPSWYKVSETLEFKDMIGLETLHGLECTLEIPGHIFGLTNLRYFDGILDAHGLSKTLDEIISWKNIKWLRLHITNSDKSYFVSDQGSALLRKLLLCRNLNALWIRDIPIGKFPPYEPDFCSNLSDLELEETKIEEDPMQFLKNLPNLRKLWLSGDAFVGEEMFCDAMFPQLIHLGIWGLPNLMKLRVDEGALRNLSYLAIGSCVKLKTITDGLNLSALKVFSIYGMPEEFEHKYKMLHEQERNN